MREKERLGEVRKGKKGDVEKWKKESEEKKWDINKR